MGASAPLVWLVAAIAAVVVLVSPPSQAVAGTGPVGKTNAFSCYHVTVAAPRPAHPQTVQLRDALDGVHVDEAVGNVKTVCNPANDTDSTGMHAPPAAGIALVCYAITPSQSLEHGDLSVDDQFTSAGATRTVTPGAPSTYCVPAHESLQAPPSSTEPLGDVDAFECYDADDASNPKVPGVPATVGVSDAFTNGSSATLQVAKLSSLCDPVDVTEVGGASTAPAKPDIHLVCWAVKTVIATPPSIFFDDRYTPSPGYAGAQVSTSGARTVCLPSFVTSGGMSTLPAVDDPDTTNIPALAWRGENLRFVQCYGVDDFNANYDDRYGQPHDPFTPDDIPAIFDTLIQNSAQLEDWSGQVPSPDLPHEITADDPAFLWYNVRTLAPLICFRTTWTSQVAGIGLIKLTADFNVGGLATNGVVSDPVLILQQQWLPVWMTLNTPSLSEVASRAPATNPEGLGDPHGDGAFIAGDSWVKTSAGTWVHDTRAHAGELRATVTGTIPLSSQYAGLGLGSSVTLPADWAKLATALALDSATTNLEPQLRWDIHDELVDASGKTLTGTGGRNDSGSDAVVSRKNAADGVPTTNGDAIFSRAGITTSTDLNPAALPDSDVPTIGPFDPNYPEATLFPDGQLNAGDAPMPAARVDFTITPTTSTTSMIDGVGSLAGASKAKDYSRDYTGSNATARNLFAPFYSQYIPATSRDDDGYASGTDGAGGTNGFLQLGVYHDWEIAANGVLASAPGSPTQCLDHRTGNAPVLRAGPSGTQSAAVYTDEHGEARIAFLPGGSGGNGFDFDALNSTPGDTNGACDLQPVRVLGTAHISATARYPYGIVPDPDKPAAAGVVATVYNLYDKHLSVYPKNYNPSSPNAQVVKLVVAHSQDVDGQPMAGEVVCFAGTFQHSSAPVSAFFPPIGSFSVLRPDGSSFVVTSAGQVASPLGAGYACSVTDGNGNVVLEATSAIADTAHMLAYFTDEAISRRILVDFTAPLSVIDNRSPTPETVLPQKSS
jgi:hypothetical protein